MSPETRLLSTGLEQVLSQYTLLVRSVGRRHGLAETDLEEIMQDVRVRLWRAQGTNETITAISSSYVYQTARSAALDLVRRRREKREVPLEMREDMDGAAMIPAPDDGMEYRELADRIGQAIGALSPTRRPVVRMYLSGYSGNEIALVMGWSEAKVRNLLYRGLADLREILTRAGIGPQGVR